MRISYWCSDVCSSDLLGGVMSGTYDCLADAFPHGSIAPGLLIGRLDIQVRGHPVVNVRVSHGECRDRHGYSAAAVVFRQEWGVRPASLCWPRAEERSVGKECVGVCRYWVASYP